MLSSRCLSLPFLVIQDLELNNRKPPSFHLHVGLSRGFPSPQPEMDDLLSDILLESMRLFLNASLLRQNSRTNTETDDSEELKAQHEGTNIQSLMVYFETAGKANTIKIDGLFPQVIAQKTKQSRFNCGAHCN